MTTATTTVAIVDYDSGNLHSAEKAFVRAARSAMPAVRVVVTARPDEVAAADRVVLPGVGAFADCRRGLFAVDGMVDAIEDAVRVRGRPFLGICVGMQLMAAKGHERGDHDGLGWIAGDVRVLEPAGPAAGELPVRPLPHMGWNELAVAEPDHPVLAGVGDGAHVYFVHSYQVVCADAGDVLARADYGGPVTAMIGRGNMVGTQFHPEKSQATGLRLIENFLAWSP
jgi:glutamine amidotransferase